MNFKNLFLKSVFITILVLGCKKTDFNFKPTAENQASVEAKFFNTNRTGSAEENALVNFLQRKNNKEHFVEKTVAQIGYPRWDKILKKPNKKTLVVGDAAVMGTGGGTTAGDDVYYIPFVRDSQNYVNAAMVIKTSATDTLLSYKCDWQYKSKPHGNATEQGTAESFALFFMFLDRNTLGHEQFQITDTTLFSGKTSKTGKRIVGSINRSTNNNNGYSPNKMVYYEVCLDWYVCNWPEYCQQHGGCDYSDCPGNPPCYSIGTKCGGYWDDDGTGDGVGGGGGDGGIGGDGSGGGGGGGGSAPPSPCGVEQPNGTNSVHNNPETMVTFKTPCGGNSPGWEPVDGGGQYINSQNPGVGFQFSFFSGPAIDLNKYFKCFDNIPDAGATYSVKLCADIPDNSYVDNLFVGTTPGHVFLTITKTNGTQSVTQSFGFYPKIAWLSISMAAVASKIVDDRGHEYNASITMDNISQLDFLSIKNLSLSLANSMSYDLDNYNCTNYALDIFNFIRPTNKLNVPDWIPQYYDPFTNRWVNGDNYHQTPNGLYKLLNSMNNNSSVQIGTFAAPISHGPCN